jgi:hypothetical protein
MARAHAALFSEADNRDGERLLLRRRSQSSKAAISRIAAEEAMFGLSEINSGASGGP